ncbi:hypothetical protein MJ391_22915 [Escherichia coli]|nr:hypothetical protein MJ391_22915 [Escherichia coli]
MSEARTEVRVVAVHQQRFAPAVRLAQPVADLRSTYLRHKGTLIIARRRQLFTFHQPHFHRRLCFTALNTKRNALIFSRLISLE